MYHLTVTISVSWNLESGWYLELKQRLDHPRITPTTFPIFGSRLNGAGRTEPVFVNV